MSEDGKLKIHNINKILSLIYSLVSVRVPSAQSSVVVEEADVGNILGSF